MPRADNHPAHQAIVVIAVIAAATVAAAFAFGKYAVFVPVVLIPAWRLTRSAGVAGEFASKGWSGRRFKDYWVYEEKQGKDRPSLSIKLRREGEDRFVMDVPTEADWQREMPLWAAQRRREIMARIVTAWDPADVHWPAGETPVEPVSSEE